MASDNSARRMTQRRILIIPHQPHRNVRVRALEMANFLAAQSQWEVYVLTWQAGPGPSKQYFKKIVQKAENAFNTLSTPISEITADNIHWITMPYLLAPAPFCQSVNAMQIARVMRHYQIDAVINANAYHFPVPESALRRGTRKPPLYLYDVIDDHLSENSGPAWRKTRRFTLQECDKANHRLSISHGLSRLIGEHFDAPLYIPNGVDINLYRQPDLKAIVAIKQRYGIQGEFCLAYIGNHGWWSGLSFLLEVFQKLRERVKAKLLVVGPGEEIASFQAKYESCDIHFTGPVPPSEVVHYFHLTDVGVLPFDLCPFTHHALPLKVLEYGAAHKRVISTPLHELEQLNLPHITLLEREIQPWVEALTQIAAKPAVWNASWDQTIAGYDWSCVFAPLQALLVQELLSEGPFESLAQERLA